MSRKVKAKSTPELIDELRQFHHYEAATRLQESNYTLPYCMKCQNEVCVLEGTPKGTYIAGAHNK